MDLYRYVSPLGGNIRISVDPFPVEDSVPTEDDIEWEVKRLLNHYSGGASGMWAEHLKGWLVAVRKKEKEAAAAKQENQYKGRRCQCPTVQGGRGQRIAYIRRVRRLPIRIGWWI